LGLEFFLLLWFYVAGRGYWMGDGRNWVSRTICRWLGWNFLSRKFQVIFKSSYSQSIDI